MKTAMDAFMTCDDDDGGGDDEIFSFSCYDDDGVFFSYSVLCAYMK